MRKTLTKKIMPNKIIPYKQFFSHSCLAACFFMLLQKQKDFNFDEKIEKEILINGMKRIYPFYAVGVPKEIFNKFKTKITIIVDNKYFTNSLIKSFKDKRNFNIVHKKITIQLIKELLKDKPLICHLDNNYLGDYSQCSHFLVLEKATHKKILLIDPFSGKKRFISVKKLEQAILSLKNHVKMCPLLYCLFN